MQQSITIYASDLESRDYVNIQDNAIKLLIVENAAIHAQFSTCFQRLNMLTAYVYYEMINPSQFYSSIADELKQLTEIQDFEIVQLAFSEQHQTEYYKTIIDSALDYLEHVEGRRE